MEHYDKEKSLGFSVMITILCMSMVKWLPAYLQLIIVSIGIIAFIWAGVREARTGKLITPKYVYVSGFLVAISLWLYLFSKAYAKWSHSIEIGLLIFMGMNGVYMVAMGLTRKLKSDDIEEVKEGKILLVLGGILLILLVYIIMDIRKLS